MGAANTGKDLDIAMRSHGYRGLGARSVFFYDPEIVADGVTDCTERLAYALTQAAADDEVGTVVIPKGTYLISDQLLQLTGSTTLKIVGEGVGQTIIKASANITDPVFYLLGTAASRQARFQLSHIQFSGNDKDVVFLQVKYAGYSLIENCLFRDCNLTAISAESWWDSDVRSCEFASGGTSGTPMFWLKDTLGIESVQQNCNNIRCTDCRWELCSGVAVHWGDESRNNTLKNCKIEGCNKGLVLDNCTRSFVVAGCHFTHMGSDAISMSNACQGNAIEGNLFDGNGGWGVDLGDSTYSIVARNIFGPEANTSGNIDNSGGTNNDVADNREIA